MSGENCGDGCALTCPVVLWANAHFLLSGMGTGDRVVWWWSEHASCESLSGLAVTYWLLPASICCRDATERLLFAFGGRSNWVSFGDGANMHLVKGRCVTCAVLRAVMFCCDASSCFRSTFDIAIKSLSVLVLIGTCVFWITCMGSVQSANCCALALSVGLWVDAYLCLLWVRPIVVFLCDAVNIHAVWTVRWAHFFYW